MTQFDEAARKAAESIERAKEVNSDEWFLIPITEMTSIITKHYAEIEAVFQKLVELAVAIRWIIEFDTNLSAGRNHLLDFDMLKVKMRERDKLLSDPQVKAVMERGKG
jgi:hypothetical protein